MRPVLLWRNQEPVEDCQIRGREAKIDRLQIRIELRRGGRAEEDHVGPRLAGGAGESDGGGGWPPPPGDRAKRTASLLRREPPVRERLLDQHRQARLVRLAQRRPGAPLQQIERRLHGREEPYAVKAVPPPLPVRPGRPPPRPPPPKKNPAPPPPPQLVED